MKHNHSKKYKAVIRGAIQLFSMIICLQLYATETARSQQPIIVHTLSENNGSNAWPKGEKALIHELHHSGYTFRTQPTKSVLSNISELRFSKNTTVVQIVRLPNESQATINIWFFQKNPPRVFHTALRRLETESQEAPVVAALKFNEVYKSKLEKIQAMAKGENKKTKPPQNLGATKKKEASVTSPMHVQFGLGTAASTYFSNAPMRLGPTLELAWSPHRRLLLALQFEMGMWGKAISSDTQQDALRHFRLNLHLDVMFRSPKKIRPFVGILLGGSRFQTRGNTSADPSGGNTNTELSPSDERANTLNLGIRTGIVFAFSRNFSFVTTLALAGLLPRVEVYFSPTNAVATYGPFYGATSVAIRIHF